MGCPEKGVSEREWGMAGEGGSSVSILAQGENYCVKEIQDMKGAVRSWGGREWLGNELVLVPMGSCGCFCDGTCSWTRILQLLEKD